MLKHELNGLFEVFVLPNPEQLSLVKMALTRPHTGPDVHHSLQDCSSQAHLLALSSENFVRNSRRASTLQSAHSTVYVRPANFTGSRSPLVLDFQIEGKLNGNLA